MKEVAPAKPKNLIIQWDSPKVVIKQELKNLGNIQLLFNPLSHNVPRVEQASKSKYIKDK